MDVQIIKYSPEKAKKRASDFKKEAKKLTNVLYFFYNDEECLYVGESGVTLYDRCFVHTNKEKSEPWFNEGNKVIIISLGQINDERESTKEREALEGVFIVTNKPKYNKKG